MRGCGYSFKSYVEKKKGKGRRMKAQRGLQKGEDKREGKETSVEDRGKRGGRGE